MQFYYFLSLYFASQAVAANPSLTSKGCVDASGFESCQNDANKQTSSCISQAKKDSSQKELLACGCQDSVNNYNCYAAYCWNRVWECEYQEYIIAYMQNCLTAKLPVPYFPAPKDAPDACSCNLGKVNIAVNDAIQQAGTCSNNANSGDAGANLQQIEGCSCCELSGALSSIVEICPDTDPKLVGLSNIATLESQLNVQYTDCGKYMDAFDCQSDLSFSLDGVSTFLKPDDALKTGSATLSNGPGSVTTPASGHVFSYTNGGDGVVYTITAAKDKAGSGDKGKSEATQTDSDATGTASADGTKKTKPSSKSAATALTTKGYLGLVVALVSAFAMW